MAHAHPVARRGGVGSPGSLPFSRFEMDAMESSTEWRTGFEVDLDTGMNPSLESQLAKYRKLVPVLALAFHLADGHYGPVGFASTFRALHWRVYLQTHARQCQRYLIRGNVPAILRSTLHSSSSKVFGCDALDNFYDEKMRRIYYGYATYLARSDHEILCIRPVWRCVPRWLCEY